MAQSGRISEKKSRALVALLEAPTVAEAAGIVGLGARTLY